MKFEDFKKKVGSWATVRGIYEQSSEANQQAKALEEIGEYITAKDDHERMDAIGDIAVCIVNAAWFRGETLAPKDSAYIAPHISKVAKEVLFGFYQEALSELKKIAVKHDYIFEECLSSAWNEIKDRKGLMRQGKFVKWENLNNMEREEFKKKEKEND